MQRVSSLIDTRDGDYRANDLHNRRLAAELKERQKVARHVRPERDRERLRRQNKMFVRDRIDALLDPGTPFLELSTLAGNMAYDGEVPGAAQVTALASYPARKSSSTLTTPVSKVARGIRYRSRRSCVRSI